MTIPTVDMLLYLHGGPPAQHILVLTCSSLRRLSTLQLYIFTLPCVAHPSPFLVQNKCSPHILSNSTYSLLFSSLLFLSRLRVILHLFSLTPTFFHFLSITPAIIRFPLLSHPLSNSFLSLHLSSTYHLHPVTLARLYMVGG